MRENFKTILSSSYNDIELVEDMLHNGYKLVTIVTPNNYPYASTEGYIYIGLKIFGQNIRLMMII